MNRLLVEAGREKREAEGAKRKYHAATRKIEDSLITLEVEKRALMDGKRIEAEAAIKEAREELRQAVNLLKKKKEPVQAHVAERYAETSHKLMGHFESEGKERLYSELEKIERGQLVYHKKLKQKGIIQSVDPSAGRAMVMLGKVKMFAEIQDLEVAKDAQESGLDESAVSVSWDINSGPSKELNVIGFRIDEAIPLIDKAIDRALVDGELTLRIIHGLGTGRLRDAIRGHLKGIPFVKKIYSADPRFGGDAITIVEL
jgi:DNA mismatch repair protein MutS2